MSTLKNKKIKASDFDADFERGDIVEHLDLKAVKARYPTQRMSIDFPKNVLDELDI